ncbi:MAG TPA: GDSL-type esterase/lipase family protein [Xanthobacteraceae bacterium]|nr:GDSL-type esterase/lipase family protein [Xanthobacteraceae bacterium]
MLRNAPANSPTIRIVSIGDSVIAGKCADPNRGWVDIFARELSHNQSTIKLINNGRGGSTIAEIRRRLQKDCIDQKPDVVILGIGVNDSRFRPSQSAAETPIEKFRAGLDGILFAIREKTRAKIIVAGQVPVIDRLVDPFKDDKHYRRASQLEYERELHEASVQYQALFIDNFTRWVERGEEFIRSHLEDGLHPNNAGHRDIAAHAGHLYDAHFEALS